MNPITLYNSTFSARKSGTTNANTVYISGMIGGGFSDEDTTAMSAVSALNSVESDIIEISINSPGGSVMDGYVIANHIRTLRHTGKTVNCTITGMAASIAAYITTACNTVKMHRDAVFMIHRTSACVSGRADELRSEAETLDKLNSQITQAYIERTGLPPEELEKLMVGVTGDGTVMNAEEAKKYNFIDEILTLTAKGENAMAKVKNAVEVTEEVKPAAEEIKVTEEVKNEGETIEVIEKEEPHEDPEEVVVLKNELQELKNELAELKKTCNELKKIAENAKNFQNKMAPIAAAPISQNLSKRAIR